MPIPVRCQCGASFQAPDQLAGKVTTCPSCQGQLPIPAGQGNPANAQMDDLLDEIGVDATAGTAGKCPNCYADLQPNAVICIGCGTNLETGTSVLKKKKKHFMREAPDDGPSLGDSRLDKAAKEMAKDAEDAKKSNDPVVWWIYLAVLDLVLSLCVTAAVMMMTFDDLKSRRMQMLHPNFEVLEEGSDNIVVIATAASSFTHPPPYEENNQGNLVHVGGRAANTEQSGKWGRRLESQNGYTNVSTAGWIHSNSLLDIDPSILQGYKDNPDLGRVKDLEYGLYKGLRIGMMLMAFLSGVIAVIAVGQSTVSAFEESPLEGALCLTIIYAPYYAFMRWYKLRSIFKMFVFGVTLFIFALVIYFSIPTLLPLVRGFGQL
jgi:hypothetical protein